MTFLGTLPNQLSFGSIVLCFIRVSHAQY